MTTKHATGFMPLDLPDQKRSGRNWSKMGALLSWGLIQWPWLLRSLYGGTAASKRALLNRLGLPADALPNLGSWKADTFFLHRLIDVVEELRPRVVVELGSGATSLVIAAALRANGDGTLYSFDQHRPFLDEMGQWLAEHELAANFQHAPLTRQDGWPGAWYQLGVIPEEIDLLIVDGPPWTVHPLVRGAAEKLFSRLSPGGVVMLDDAARPGERAVARRWRERWPDFRFDYERGGSKGLLVGQRKAGQR